MDWDYILSLAPDTLSEETNEELVQLISWFDCSDPELSEERSVVLLKISQELLKYKSAQVEELLAELDEVATKQGEIEARKLESDFSSVKSKRSDSADIIDLEQKYRDLKTKCKKLQKTVDKANAENAKFQQQINLLEQERKHLQNELQRSHQDDSSSDMSEAIKDQQKDLIENVRLKNNQITNLLSDIENIESDNSMLRSKLTSTRDELADATEKIELLLDEAKASKIRIEELEEISSEVKKENNSLRNEMSELIEDKQQRENDYEHFVKEIDTRIDDWKKILDEKNMEIQALKSVSTKQVNSASEESSDCKSLLDQSQVDVLTSIIEDRERQILELKTQLVTATKEMETSTDLLKKLTKERDDCAKQTENSKQTLRNVKKQAKAAHSRCQDFQEQVKYLENFLNTKDREVLEMIEKVKDGDTKEILKELHMLNVQRMNKDKRIFELVSACNKLQNSVDCYEKENVSLRTRLGLSEDDFVSTKGASIQQRKQKKLMQNLQKEIERANEDKLHLKLEIQKLTKTVSNLCNQIIDFGETPDLENSNTTGIKDFDPGETRANKDKAGEEKTKHENAEIQTTGVTTDTVDTTTSITTAQSQLVMPHASEAVGEAVSKVDYKAVVNENDALRKGLHEILDSINSKRESQNREIKSETLEKLLLALDVKHVSGWYHPAMRLQAELHAVQGSNSELREQLRLAREELEKYRNTAENQIIITGNRALEEGGEFTNSNFSIANLNQHLVDVLKNYRIEEETNATLIEKLGNYKKEFIIIQEQIAIIYEHYAKEKQTYENELENFNKFKYEMAEKVEVLEAKVGTFHFYSNPSNDDEAKLKKTMEMASKLAALNRKSVYLENQETIYRRRIQNLRNDLLDCENVTRNKIIDLNEQIDKLKKNGTNTVNLQCCCANNNKLQENYDKLLIKERELIRTIDSLKRVNVNEMLLLNKTIENLQVQNKELEASLLDIKVQIIPGDLSKKLAQIEVNEITERQRANHTNNLYELVKEQLAKSEERYKESQKYSNEIMHKNLKLQENIKDLEQQLKCTISLEIYHTLEKENAELLIKLKHCKTEKEQLENEIAIVRNDSSLKQLWCHLEEYEFLNLKHQLVDLQSIADDKAIIARLSSDVVVARVAEAELQKKLGDCLKDMNAIKNENDDLTKDMGLEKEKFEVFKNGMEKKIRSLEFILEQHKEQYLGFIPFGVDYKIVEHIQQIGEDNLKSFEKFQNVQNIEMETKILNENAQRKLDVLDDLKMLINKDGDYGSILEKWYQEKSNIELQELRYKRQSQFKEMQLEQYQERLKNQEKQIVTLELELLETLTFKESSIRVKPKKHLQTVILKIAEILPDEIVKLTRTEETQTTIPMSHALEGNIQNVINTLQNELVKKTEEVITNKALAEQTGLKVVELENSIASTKQQLGDKQSQLHFFEKHILELQSKREAVNNVVNNTEELLLLKNLTEDLKKKLNNKDDTILKYQSLIKKDRDEHSLAAARFQEELKQLQGKLATANRAIQNYKDAPKSEEDPNRNAIEQYILQVHALEKHTAEMHTTVTTLNSQLQASRQESVRWRSLANDRLENMDELRTVLEEQHQSELTAYKEDCEKWRDEVRNMQQYINRYKKDSNELRPDMQRELREKDNKIHELTVTLRQLRSSLRQKKSESQASTCREDNFEEIKETLYREHEVLKKRCEQVMNREKNAREEIRTLKGQLMRRPVMSARSDSGTTSTKEQQLQKKVSVLEKLSEELQEKLEREMAANDTHKAKVHEDFQKWNKQKLFQQSAEKLKQKLREKGEEYDKLQQTCSGYRILIERLEREKQNLEIRLRNLKTNTTNFNVVRFEMLEIENEKLRADVMALRSKLEMQQHHAGGLGAALLEEKLEGQERKIAILEMSARGGGELRSELERLQSTNANLQKSNLRLEAENLELRLDLEKSTKELPHLREQLVHLESYIDALKSENSQHQVTSAGDSSTAAPDASKVSQLERTVYVLKRIVEKLQVENKRLASGSGKPCSDRVHSAERLRRDCNKLREQHISDKEKLAKLEQELKALMSGKLSATSEIEQIKALKEELEQKSMLLEKVKALLHRAAAKEKNLLEQVASLKQMNTCVCDRNIAH